MQIVLAPSSYSVSNQIPWGKSTNSRVTTRFLALIPSMTWLIVIIVLVVGQFLQILSCFVFFLGIFSFPGRNRIKRQGFYDVSSYSCKSYASVVIRDYEVTFLLNRKD